MADLWPTDIAFPLFLQYIGFILPGYLTLLFVHIVSKKSKDWWEHSSFDKFMMSAALGYVYLIIFQFFSYFVSQPNVNYFLGIILAFLGAALGVGNAFIDYKMKKHRYSENTK